MASKEARDPNLMAEIMNLMSELAEEFQSKYGGCHIGTNVGSYQSAKHLHWYIHAGERVRDRQGLTTEATVVAVVNPLSQGSIKTHLRYTTKLKKHTLQFQSQDGVLAQV